MPRQKRKVFEATSKQLDKFPRRKTIGNNASISTIENTLNVTSSHQLLREQVEKIINYLPLIERRVLQMGFGLLDGRSRTAGEIANELGISLEEVNEIEENALRKLRSPIENRKPSEIPDA